MTLPDQKQSRAGASPLHARVMLAGTPKVGKSTLAAAWAPDTTLIVDTHNGTKLLDGEHFIAHVKSWAEFEAVVNDIEAAATAGDLRFETVVLDLVDDLWIFADGAHAGKGKTLATATDDYGRSGKSAEGAFRQVIGRLLALPIGVWFLTHTKTIEDAGVTRHVAKLDGKVVTYVQGAADFVFLAEHLGPRRLLHTAPSAKFEAGSRVPLPEPMDLDARALYAAMNAGLNPKAPKKGAKKDEPVADAPAAETEPADAEKEMTTA